MFYWFGDPETEVDPADVVQVAVDPTSQAEHSLCTEPLALTAENMLLAVVPYSWDLGAPWGFGREHQFLFTVSECGSNGEACCYYEDFPDDPAHQCVPGTVCDKEDLTYETGTCIPCGNYSEACCENGYQCVSSPERPRTCIGNVGGDPTCERCGDLGERCCDDVITGGQTLLDWCAGNGVFCDSGTCRECGGTGDACCPSGYCDSSDDKCDNGTCVSRYTPCGRVVRAGGAEGGHFVVDLGKPSGVFHVVWNSYLLADDMTLAVGNEVIARLGCAGTDTLAGCTGTPGALGTWCCKGGVCDAWLSYRGSNLLNVDVIADCAGGQPETEWEFTVSCPK